MASLPLLLLFIAIVKNERFLINRLFSADLGNPFVAQRKPGMVLLSLLCAVYGKMTLVNITYSRCVLFG